VLVFADCGFSLLNEDFDNADETFTPFPAYHKESFEGQDFPPTRQGLHFSAVRINYYGIS